jgi:hypothetical protein
VELLTIIATMVGLGGARFWSEVEEKSDVKRILNKMVLLQQRPKDIIWAFAIGKQQFRPNVSSKKKSNTSLIQTKDYPS